MSMDILWQHHVFGLKALVFTNDSTVETIKFWVRRPTMNPSDLGLLGIVLGLPSVFPKQLKTFQGNEILRLWPS